MSIIIPAGHPVQTVFEAEGIAFTTLENKEVENQRIVSIGILNILPTLLDTEMQLLRILSNSPIPLRVTMISPIAPMNLSDRPSSLTSDNKEIKTNELEGRVMGKLAPKSVLGLEVLYKRFEDIKTTKFDAFLIAGTPNEAMPFDQLPFWNDLTEIMQFCNERAGSTLFINWAAQAGLYYNYRIGKGALKERLSGVYQHRLLTNSDPLLRGVDGQIFLPHSRCTGLDEHAVIACSELEVLVFGTRSKSTVLKSMDDRLFFFTGNGEFDEDTLHKEYLRNLKKGARIKKPSGYYCHGKPRSRWKSTAALLFTNWLNYYVYQAKK